MSFNEPSTPQAAGSNRRLILLLSLAAVLLCAITAVAGFAIGRATAPPETIVETVTEQEEVTREVTREVEVPVIESDIGESEEVEDVNEDAGDAAETADDAAGETGSTDDDDDNDTREATAQDDEPEPRVEDVDEIEFDIFYEAWSIVEDDFDGELPANEEILYSAIEGSLDTLGDEYTRFVRPEVAARLREDAGGAVEGIGAFVRENDEGFFEIVRPIPDQPADLVGLLPGDIVIAVDGESVLDATFDEVILMVRGPRGTDVTLTIEREGEEEPLEFTITRVRFEIPTVESEMLEENIGHIHLTEFNRTATDKLLEAMDTLLADGAESIIFDLRDNPGGFLDQSINVADIFLPASTVLFERNRDGLDEVFRADDGDVGEEIPLVVLVNEGSASASEIVAGAIQDNGRAVLIGATTFGKGSVQQVHTLSDGSEVRVTIARWYTPNDNTIDGEGITPDIVVPMEFDAEEDIQLQRAIEYVETGE